jgi:2-polyprenyl-6-methoxyphenol hydroxylase-like FAD-dependent oxidoreductase
MNGDHASTVDATRIANADVLIVGAGPTGLVLAIWLTRLGVRVRIVDKAAAAGTSSRALVVHARTLELYRQIGLADAVVAGGRRMTSTNLWAAGKQVAHAVIGDMGVGISPFPYALIFPQDEHERVLIDHLSQIGVEVERQTEFVAFEQASRRVRARCTRADGSTVLYETAYIAGCDGAHSAVRQALEIGFPGGTYEHLFYVADVEARGQAMNGELHAALDTTEFLAVFPLKDDGHARLVGTVLAGASEAGEDLSWRDVSRRVIDWMRIDVQRVHWFSTYRVHHRVADRFRRGCAFLLGDAAHIHSPVGGQGMNTGIGDAVNLAWKLAAVVNGANESLLDSYEPERIAFARRLVATTDRAFTAVTSNGRMARWLRLKAAPLIIPIVLSSAALRRFMFRTVSQTEVNYRDSPLSHGRAGAVHGGDRLPWVRSDPNNTDNFATLTSVDWQLHVYGEAALEIQALCEERALALHVFSWGMACRRAGLRRNAAYLVRPDGYVAVADPEGSGKAVRHYLERLGTSIGK